MFLVTSPIVFWLIHGSSSLPQRTLFFQGQQVSRDTAAIQQNVATCTNKSLLQGAQVSENVVRYILLHILTRNDRKVFFVLCTLFETISYCSRTTKI